MKKIVLIIIVFLIAILSGCSTNRSTVDVAREVLYCFDNDDVEGLKSLFCEEILSNINNLDEQIEEAFELYEGKSEEIGPITTASQKSVRNGVVVKKTATPRIPIYNTDEGKEYVISIRMFTENKDNPDLIGINKINIYVRNNDGNFELAKEIGKLIP